MSTAGRMTIAWDRGDQLGLLPADSSVVEAGQFTTIYWRALTTPTTLDYDPTDLIVTPGAEEEVIPPGEAAGSPPPPGEGGGGGPGPGEGAQGGRPVDHGPPHLVVAHRRGVKRFLKDGLYVHLQAPARGRVRLVLQAKVKGSKGMTHTVKLTKVLTAEVGTAPEKLTLHPSRGGRVLLGRLEGLVSCTLLLVVNYGDGQSPIEIRRHVRIVGS